LKQFNAIVRLDEVAQILGRERKSEGHAAAITNTSRLVCLIGDDLAIFLEGLSIGSLADSPLDIGS
jgi:hypothetical protein